MLHQRVGLVLEPDHGADRGPKHLRVAVERLVQELQDRAVRDVELVLRGSDPTSERVVGGARVSLHRLDSVPVDGDHVAGGPRCRGVTSAVSPTELELLEAEVVPDLVALGMEHVAVPIPDLGAPRAFALDDDLVQRGERGGEVC